MTLHYAKPKIVRSTYIDLDEKFSIGAVIWIQDEKRIITKFASPKLAKQLKGNHRDKIKTLTKEDYQLIRIFERNLKNWIKAETLPCKMNRKLKPWQDEWWRKAEEFLNGGRIGIHDIGGVFGVDYDKVLTKKIGSDYYDG